MAFFDRSKRASTISELPILTAMASFSGMSMLAVDNKARITAIIGKNNHDANIAPQSAVGQFVDAYFVKVPGYAKLFHEALNNRPQKTTFQNASGNYFETNVIPLFDEKNKICGAFSFEQDITERLKFETTVKSQELYIADVLASISEGVFIVDRTHTIHKTNPAFEEMYPEHLPLVGKKCYVTSCLDHVCNDCPASKVFATGKTAMSIHYEQPTETKSGMWLEHFAYPISAPSGETVAAICIIRDVTKRKEYEETLAQYNSGLEELVDERTRNLEQSESRMRTIIAGGNVPIAFADPDGFITFANTAFQTLTGYSETELIGKRPWDTIYDERTKTDFQFQEERAAFYAGKTDQHRQDLTIWRKDGAIRWVDFTASAVNDSDGKRIQIIFILLDITERYKIERAVKEANALAGIMLDSAPLGCTILDSNNNVTDCNLEAVKLFGAANKQEFCKRFSEFSPEYQPDGRLSAEKRLEYVTAALETGQQRVEWMHQTLDGTPIICEVTLVRVKQGNEFIIAGYARDLREEKRMLADVYAANERTQIMLDSNLICSTIWDTRFNIIDCNLEALRVFGIPNKQEFCQRFSEFSPEYQPNGRLSADIRAEALERAFATGFQNFEYMHQKLDGTLIPSEITLVRVKQENSILLVGYIRDLREEKRMLAEISDANERTQIMLDTAPLSCTIIDKEGNVLDCNTGSPKLFGIPSKQEFCSKFFELAPEFQPDGQLTKEKFFIALAQVFETGYIRLEWMHQKLDGTQIPCEVTAVRVKQDDSYVAVCYARDLREEKRMLAKIHDANELTRFMLDATPIGCSVWDEELNHIECNLEMVKLFEMPSKQEFLSRFFELSPEYQPNGKPSAELVKANLAKVFEKGYARFEQVHQLIDGTPVPCEITLVRVPHGNGFNICGYMRDLREEKRMLAEIYDTNERVRIMLDSTPLCATLFDEEFNPVYCNQEAVNLFELRDKQEYLGRFFELSPEYQPNGLSTREVAVKNLKTAFSNGYYRFEHIHQKLDGTPVPAEITLVRVQRGDGYIVVGYARDLREEKKILAEKQEADERAAIMLDMTPMACALFDMNGNVIDCNKESIRMAGFDSKQEFCERFFDLSPEYQPNGRLSAEMRHEKFSAAVQTGYQRYEWMYQALDGSSMPSEITLVRVKKEDSFIIAGYGRDLRELKEHEAALERDRRRMNDLLELARMTDSEEHELIDFTINSVAALTNSSMGYVVLLEHAKEVLPFRSVVLDKKIDCMLPLVTEHGTPHTLSRYLTECIEKRQAVIQDDFAALPGKRVFPDGHTKVRSHMNFPILDGDRHIGIIGVGNKETPYTEVDAKQLMLLGQGLSSQLNRKRYAENLERAKREAEDANKAKSEFLAHMSHEIRTPLNGVIGLSDLLVGTPLNDKQHEYVQLINASGNALLFLINDILDFSKIEAGRLEIESEPFDLSATVGAVIASLASRTSSKDLELAISFSQYLPRVVQGDSGRIRQILLNLAGNALKFTEQGGVWVNVVMESMNETTVTIKFIVTDTGIGISSNHINRLFEAFAQADVSTARVYGGTGLGLAISMKLVQLMGGTIGVESEQGKGSTFWFKIPFVCDPLTLQCLREQKCLETVDKNCSYLEGRQCTAFINRAITEGYQIKGRSVLVVDNSAIHREALSVQLRQWEMECMDCGSGEEALRLSEIQLKKEKPFDLFVIDHTLSDGTGIDLVRQLLEREKTLEGISPAQIIMLFPLSEDYEQYAFDNSRVESISKPVFASALFDAVMNRFFSAEKPPSGNFGIFDAESADNSDDASKTVKSKPGRHIKQRLHMENRPISSLAGKVHILVVEDNKINQIVAKNLLEEAGFSCDVVTNGIEACNAVRQKDYDIVLMDCLMPEMDGFEATDLIRKWEREHGKKRLPIIALTANATKEDVRKCFDVGMDAYCSKPIDARAVVQQIETWYKKSN